MITHSLSEASIQVTGSLLANQRPVFRSRDHSTGNHDRTRYSIKTGRVSCGPELQVTPGDRTILRPLAPANHPVFMAKSWTQIIVLFNFQIDILSQ